MKKLFLLLLVSALIKGCTPFDAVDGKRMLVKGEFQTTSGEGIADIPVQLITNTHFNFFIGMNEGVIFEHHSDASGDFTFTSFDIKEDMFVLSFNNIGYEFLPEQAYESITFVDERNERSEYLIDFGTLPLRRIVDLELKFINTSGTGENLSYTIDYSDIFTVVPIQSWENIPSMEDIYGITETKNNSRSLMNGQNFNYFYQTLEGTQAKLTYRIGDAAPTEIFIPILAEDFTYEVTY